VRSLTGTSKLLWLIWRRDRLRLPIWVGGLAVLVAGQLAAYKEVLKSPQDLIAVTQLYITNPSARIFALPSGLNL
jgi:ABC-2 type transport system permease protein